MTSDWNPGRVWGVVLASPNRGDARRLEARGLGPRILRSGFRRCIVDRSSGLQSILQ